jgi:hypothetical protein
VRGHPLERGPNLAHGAAVAQPRSGYSLTSPFSSRLNLPSVPYAIMNMQVGRVETAPAPTAESQAPTAESRRPAAESHSLRAGRRLYVPTIVIAGLAAWLSYRGWTALAQTGVARSFDAGRYNLAGPVVLGFVLTVCVLEQVFPAQRRPLLARGHLLDFCYAVFYALLVIPLVVLLGSGFPG